MSNYTRQHKSSVFAMLFQIPEYALEVYNVLNHSNHTDPSMVQIKHLQKGILLSVENDASFILDFTFNMYEHQSTYNPNMPLRFLIYFSSSISEIIKEEGYNLFGRKRIPIPTPNFVVFYNGSEERPEVEEMKLSDSFTKKQETYNLEISCIVYNINSGYNSYILNNSAVIRGYTSFVERVGKYRQEMQLDSAVNKAIDECIEFGFLPEFFLKHRAEVIDMFLLDYTTEARLVYERRDGFDEGITIGKEQGISIGKEQGIDIGLDIIHCIQDGLSPEETANKLDLPLDTVLRFYNI